MNKILSLLFFSLITTFSYAQHKVSGKVTDAEGEGLIGANIVIKGTTTGTQTDIEGNYVLDDVSTGDITLIASYIGYSTQSQTVKVSGATNMNFVLSIDQLGLDEVIVTGVFNEKSKLESSVAITTMNPTLIKQRLPRGTGDLLNAVPGTYVDNAGGEVGNRVYARGMASGTTDDTGFRYVSLQEDGLPVMSSLVRFATADMFHRVDVNVARLEAIRGGSSAVTAPNAPGGIYNFISKEGGTEFAGTASLQSGTNGRNLFTRADLGIGGPISESGLNYYIGGFYRYDEGARDLPFVANQGGQLKANLVYNHDKGKIKVYGKYLNDRVTQYRPVPFSNLETLEPFEHALVDFDLNYSSTFPDLQSSLPDYSFGKADGATRDFDSGNGIDVDVFSFGLSIEQDLGEWTVSNNFKVTSADQRYLQYVGNIVVPTPIATIGLGYNPAIFNPADFVFKDAATGEEVYNPTTGLNTIGSNVFGTIPLDMNNEMSDLMNQLTVSRKVGKHQLTFGGYYSRNTLKSTWHADILVGTLEPQMRPITIDYIPTTGPFAGFGTFQATNEDGFAAVNLVTLLGFEGRAQSLAVFANDVWEATDKLTLDLGVRFASIRHDGFKRGWEVEEGDGNPFTLYDALAKKHTDEKFEYDETYNLFSFSLGANMKLDDQRALYARITKGNKAPDHEQYISNYENTPIQRGEVEKVYQVEAGFKLNKAKYSLFATAFYSYLDDITFRIFSVSTNTTFFTAPTFNTARTVGLELEATATPVKNLNFRVLATLQDPRYVDFALYNTNGTSPTLSGTETLQPLLPLGTSITFPETAPTPMPNSTVSDDYYEDMSGNQVNDIPKVIIDLTGAYTYSGWTLFANWRYTGKYQYNKRNDFQLPSFNVFNLGLSKKIGKVDIAVNVNNALNELGVTRTEGAALLDGNKEFFTKEFLDNHRVNAFGIGQPGSVWAVPILPRMITGAITVNF